MKNWFIPPTDKTGLLAVRKRTFGFGIFLIVISVAAILGIMIAKNRVAQTSAWPTVPGRIVKSTTELTTSRAGRIRTTKEIACIEYEYHVDGKAYKCDLLRVIPMLHTSFDKEIALAKYRKGQSVTVFYNPEEPADALLQNQPDESALSLMRSIVFGGIFGGFIGLVMTFSAASVIFGENQSIQTTSSQPIVTKPGGVRRYPMPVRILLIGIGGVISLFGLLLILAHVTSEPDPNHSAIANAITTMVMAGIAAVGGFSVWLGASRNGRNRIPTA